MKTRSILIFRFCINGAKSFGRFISRPLHAFLVAVSLLLMAFLSACAFELFYLSYDLGNLEKMAEGETIKYEFSIFSHARPIIKLANFKDDGVVSFVLRDSKGGIVEQGIIDNSVVIHHLERGDYALELKIKNGALKSVNAEKILLSFPHMYDSVYGLGTNIWEGQMKGEITRIK
jgi:hypothetical protein